MSNSEIEDFEQKEKPKNKWLSLKNKVVNKVSDTKDKIANFTEENIEKVKNFDHSQLKDKDFYQQIYLDSKEYLNEKLEKSTETNVPIDEIIDSLRSRTPDKPKDISDIYNYCKEETLYRTMSVFFLTPTMLGLDEKRTEYFSKLSLKYGEYRDENSGLTDHTNYVEMKNIRNSAKKNVTVVENGYHKAEITYPCDVDIEHVTSRSEVFSDFFIKVGTTDHEFTDIVNDKRNLVFANSSVNRSKKDKDLLEYITMNGVTNKDNPDLIDVEINGNIHQVNKNDIEEAYDNSKEAISDGRKKALANIGISLGVTGITMAAQQAMGLIMVQTMDIFFEELKDLNIKDNILKPKQFQQHILERKESITNKLKIRFEERDLFNKAKAAGIDGGISGVLSALPQIIISLYIKLPQLIISFIREGTLSSVRSVRVLTSKSENKYDDLKIILYGSATVALSLYAATIISKAITPIPLLNTFNKQISDILSTMIIASVPLLSLYLISTGTENIKNILFQKEDASTI